MNEYPTDAELQSILDFKGTPEQFVDHINSMWWSEGFRVKRGFDGYTGIQRLTLSTWGWSGNEDIIGVMRQTMFWMLWWRESHRGGHYTFEVPTKAWWRKELPMEFGLPHSTIENGKESEYAIRNFDKTHFTATTIGGRVFLYCPVGNICSWSAGDVEHQYCEWCKSTFAEIRNSKGEI